MNIAIFIGILAAFVYFLIWLGSLSNKQRKSIPIEERWKPLTEEEDDYCPPAAKSLNQKDDDLIKKNLKKPPFTREELVAYLQKNPHLRGIIHQDGKNGKPFARKFYKVEESTKSLILGSPTGMNYCFSLNNISCYGHFFICENPNNSRYVFHLVDEPFRPSNKDELVAYLKKNPHLKMTYMGHSYGRKFVREFQKEHLHIELQHEENCNVFHDIELNEDLRFFEDGFTTSISSLVSYYYLEKPYEPKIEYDKGGEPLNEIIRRKANTPIKLGTKPFASEDERKQFLEALSGSYSEGGCPEKPRFKVGDRVTVNAGDYTGKSGIIENIYGAALYTVHIDGAEDRRNYWGRNLEPERKKPIPRFKVGQTVEIKEGILATQQGEIEKCIIGDENVYYIVALNPNNKPSVNELILERVPAFVMGDTVKVKDGYFKGRSGKVVGIQAEITVPGHPLTLIYKIQLYQNGGTVNLDESILEKIDKTSTTDLICSCCGYPKAVYEQRGHHPKCIWYKKPEIEVGDWVRICAHPKWEGKKAKVAAVNANGTYSLVAGDDSSTIAFPEWRLTKTTEPIQEAEKLNWKEVSDERVWRSKRYHGKEFPIAEFKDYHLTKPFLDKLFAGVKPGEDGRKIVEIWVHHQDMIDDGRGNHFWGLCKAIHNPKLKAVFIEPLPISKKVMARNFETTHYEG